MATAVDEIKIRISPEQKAALQRAADIEGVTLSQFLRNVAGARAQQIIAESLLRAGTALPPVSFDVLVASLEEPAAPNAAVVAAAQRLASLTLD